MYATLFASQDNIQKYKIIDFNEKDMGIYTPSKVILTEAIRRRGEYHFKG